MTPATAQKHRTDSLTILQRVVRNDRTATVDCIDIYGSLIWAMARKFTDAPVEAERSVREIFIDIWQFAGRFEASGLDERIFIMKIARRRLIIFFQKLK